MTGVQTCALPISLWLTVTRDAGLLHQHLDPVANRAAVRRFSLGNIVYAGTIGLSYVNAVLTLVVHGLIAVYYCFDQLRPRPGPRSRR